MKPELVEKRWRAFLASITAEGYGPAVVVARVMWQGLEELRLTRRELRRIRRQLEDRGLDTPTIGSDLGTLARVADPLLEAVEGISGEVARLQDTIDRARMDLKP